MSSVGAETSWGPQKPLEFDVFRWVNGSTRICVLDTIPAFTWWGWGNWEVLKMVRGVIVCFSSILAKFVPRQWFAKEICCRLNIVEINVFMLSLWPSVKYGNVRFSVSHVYGLSSHKLKNCFIFIKQFLRSETQSPCCSGCGRRFWSRLSRYTLSSSGCGHPERRDFPLVSLDEYRDGAR